MPKKDVAKKITEKSKRQMLDKAVSKVHTDKIQVKDVMKELPDKLRGDFLKELRRRGASPYPERGESKQERALEKKK